MVDFEAWYWTFRLKLVVLGAVRLGSSVFTLKPRGSKGAKLGDDPTAGGENGKGFAKATCGMVPPGVTTLVVFTDEYGFPKFGGAPCCPEPDDSKENGGLPSVCKAVSSS